MHRSAISGEEKNITNVKKGASSFSFRRSSFIPTISNPLFFSSNSFRSLESCRLFGSTISTGTPGIVIPNFALRTVSP